MNYGYSKLSKGWKEEKKMKLARALAKEFGLYIGYKPDSKPYIEVDGLYNGVTIRRITNLSNEEQKVLVMRSDVIFNEIMLDTFDKKVLK